MSVKGVTEIKTSDGCGTFRRTTSCCPFGGGIPPFANQIYFYQLSPADRKHPYFPVFALFQAASTEAALTNAMLADAKPASRDAGSTRSGACAQHPKALQTRRIRRAPARPYATALQGRAGLDAQ